MIYFASYVIRVIRDQYFRNVRGGFDRRCFHYLLLWHAFLHVVVWGALPQPVQVSKQIQRTSQNDLFAGACGGLVVVVHSVAEGE